MRVLPSYLGVGLALALWSLPLEQWVGDFPAHMLRHMGLVAVVAPLLVIGLADRSWPRISPLAATLAEFLVVWSFHLPVLHALARGGTGWFIVEQGAFLAVGLALWTSALRGGGLAGAGGLLLTSMHMTLLGALLTLAPRDLYAGLGGGAHDLAGQQLGGMLMLAIGSPVYLVAGLVLVGRELSRDAEAGT